MLKLKSSGECVNNCAINSIPSIAEVIRQEYAFNPCPPQHGPVPISPDLFLHGFLMPGDHTGDTMAEMLPKKLHQELHWDALTNSAQNVPIGWGFYIFEELDRQLIRRVVIVLTFVAIIVVLVWSRALHDVSEATGVGQLALATLGIFLSAPFF